MYKSSEVVYWPLAKSFLGVGYRWINASGICENNLAYLHKAFQILKKLIRKLLAAQGDAGKHGLSSRPGPPFLC